MLSKKVSLIKLDVLKEIATIGSGRAATSLADLLGAQIALSVPDTRLYPFQQIADLLGDAKSFFILEAKLEGDIEGMEYFMLSESEARMLGSVLLGMPGNEINLADEMVQSSLKEVANILLSSYMNALSELTGFTVMVSVPELSTDVIPSAVDAVLTKAILPTQEVLYVKSLLKVKEKDFNGLIFFVPTSASLEKMFKKLGIID